MIRVVFLAIALTLATVVALAAFDFNDSQSVVATHDGDKNCSDFPNQEAAQDHLNAHPGDPDNLDGDDDGSGSTLWSSGVDSCVVKRYTRSSPRTVRWASLFLPLPNPVSPDAIPSATAQPQALFRAIPLF